MHLPEGEKIPSFLLSVVDYHVFTKFVPTIFINCFVIFVCIG